MHLYWSVRWAQHVFVKIMRTKIMPQLKNCRSTCADNWFSQSGVHSLQLNYKILGISLWLLYPFIIQSIEQHQFLAYSLLWFSYISDRETDTFTCYHDYYLFLMGCGGSKLDSSGAQNRLKKFWRDIKMKVLTVLKTQICLLYYR